MKHALAVVATACGLSVAHAQPEPFDLILLGGRVVDGTGGAAREADVGIRAGRIAAVGRLAGAAARP